MPTLTEDLQALIVQLGTDPEPGQELGRRVERLKRACELHDELERAVVDGHSVKLERNAGVYQATLDDETDPMSGGSLFGALSQALHVAGMLGNRRAG